MARPKTQNPRSLTTTMRLTAPESAYLTERWGSPGKGLRALLSREMKGMKAGPRRDGMDHQEPAEGSVRLAPAAPERGADISGVWVDEASQMTMPANAEEQVAAHEARMQVTVEPRQSGKTKKALEAVEAAKAKGLNVTVAEPIPEGGLKGLPDAPAKQARHLHKPEGDPIRTFAEKGVQWKVYLCACGEELKR